MTHEIELLRDMSPMPYGSYKGVQMQRVPALYLHKLWHAGGLWAEKSDPVHEYIVFAWRVLRSETPGTKWYKEPQKG